MPQRKCGTCKYFDEGDIAASGWCRHPERQDLQYMVLVRKTELACRNGWNEDLWEPSEAQQVRPSTTGSGASQDDAREDVHFSETSVMTATAPSPSAQSNDTVRGPVHGSSGRISADQTATLQRKEQSVDRYEEERSKRQIPLDDSPQREAESGGDSERTLNESPAGRPKRPSWLEEVRERQLAQSQRAPRKPDLSSTASHTADNRDERSDRDASSQQQESVHRVFRQPENHNRMDSFDERDDRPVGPPARGSTPRFGAQSSHGSEHPEVRRVQQSGKTEPFDLQHDSEQQDGIAREQPEIDESVQEDPPRQISLPKRIAEIPVCCKTCRDFRPSETGDRGWCQNPFAFDQQQLVSAEGVGCHGTYGNWWAPSDEWWLQQADITHHAAPTPNVDELLQELQVRSQQSKRKD